MSKIEHILNFNLELKFKYIMADDYIIIHYSDNNNVFACWYPRRGFTSFKFDILSDNDRTKIAIECMKLYLKAHNIKSFI